MKIKNIGGFKISPQDKKEIRALFTLLEAGLRNSPIKYIEFVNSEKRQLTIKREEGNNITKVIIKN